MKTEKQIRAAKRYAVNRRKLLAYQKAYNADHQEERRTFQKGYHTAHRDERLAASRAYQAAHREKMYAHQASYQRQRRATDPGFKLLHNLRTRIYHAVTGGVKSVSTRRILGCTIPELRAHLESQFRSGMTWENYGPVWHIDHRRPCASFDLLDPAQQRVCFHYTNLQPLFAEENLKKGSR